MIIQYESVPGQPLSDEQIKEIENASLLPPVYDEDCPELTPAMLKSLKTAVRNRNRANSMKKA